MPDSTLDILAFFKSAPISDAELVLEVGRLIVQDRKSRPGDASSLPRSKYFGTGSNTAENHVRERETLRARMAAVLRENGKPTNAIHITEMVNGRFKTSTSRETVHGELARWVRKGEVFTRVDRGRYGLKEWGAAPVSDESTDDHASAARES